VEQNPAIKHTDTFEPLGDHGDDIESVCFTDNVPNLAKALKCQYGAAVEVIESNNFWQDLFESKTYPQDLTYLTPSESLPRIDVHIDFSVEKITSLRRKVILGPLHAKKWTSSSSLCLTCSDRRR